MSQVLSGKYNTKHDAVDAYTTAWNQFAYLLLEIEDLEMEAETLLKNYLIEAEKRGSN